MICPDCQTSVQSDMKYCPVCGSALARSTHESPKFLPGGCLCWFSKILNFAWEERTPFTLCIPIGVWLLLIFLLLMTIGYFPFMTNDLRLDFLLILSHSLGIIRVLFLFYAIYYGVKTYREGNENGFRIAILFFILSLLALVMPIRQTYW